MKINEERNLLRAVRISIIYENRPLFLVIWETDKRMSTGQEVIGYWFGPFAGEALFEGEDFGVPPSVAIDSDEALVELLGFLTLKRGDTDAEYFEKYTERQSEWSESSECEELALDVHDFGTEGRSLPFLDVEV